jgi:hypothetical protein
MEELVDWKFADYIFNCDWDIMSSTIKIRQAGFHDCIDSEAAVIEELQTLCNLRIIPQP